MKDMLLHRAAVPRQTRVLARVASMLCIALTRSARQADEAVGMQGRLLAALGSVALLTSGQWSMLLLKLHNAKVALVCLAVLLSGHARKILGTVGADAAIGEPHRISEHVFEKQVPPLWALG